MLEVEEVDDSQVEEADDSQVEKVVQPRQQQVQVQPMEVLRPSELQGELEVLPSYSYRPLVALKVVAPFHQKET